MATALISLGSNIGDRAEALRGALALLARTPGMRVAAASTFHETKPAGGSASQEKFLNAAARLETELPPREVLSALQNVEHQLGRVRSERWGPRTIDLDLLLYDELELETPELTLPHPRMSFRRFVLEPAAEIAAEMVHPVCGNTIGGLLSHMEYTPRYVALAGLDGLGRAILQRKLRTHSEIHFLPRTPGFEYFHFFQNSRRYQFALSRMCMFDPVTASADLLRQLDLLDRNEWLVSDYWLGEASCWRALMEIDDSLAQVVLKRQAQAFPVKPRLVVIVDVNWSDTSKTESSDSGEPATASVADEEGVARYYRELHRVLHDEYQGAILWRQHSERVSIGDDVLAAIAAME